MQRERWNHDAMLTPALPAAVLVLMVKAKGMISVGSDAPPGFHGLMSALAVAHPRNELGPNSGFCVALPRTSLASLRVLRSSTVPKCALGLRYPLQVGAERQWRMEALVVVDSCSRVVVSREFASSRAPRSS